MLGHIRIRSCCCCCCLTLTLVKHLESVVTQRSRRNYVVIKNLAYDIQLAKMSFDEIFDLTAGVYFPFYNICTEHELVVPITWYATIQQHHLDISVPSL